MHQVSRGVVELNCSKPALTQWLTYTMSTSTFFEVAHTSPHIHHINTPLWILSRLPTRRPSIALTLILRILEYPLSLVYERCKGSKFPYPRNPAIRIDIVNPAGVYFFTHTPTTYRHVHVMSLGNLQAEAWRGCRPRPD
jgi:hypothetical protein